MFVCMHKCTLVHMCVRACVYALTAFDPLIMVIYNAYVCIEVIIFITHVLQVAGLDPLIGDGIEFAKKLIKLGN